MQEYTVQMPECVATLVTARNAVRAHYLSSGRPFPFDGKLLGDIGEAVAVELFGLKWPSKRTKGVDALTPDDKTVQVKATGVASSGPAYTRGEATANFLVFLYLDFDNCRATVRYNGPEAPVRALLPKPIVGTEMVRLSKIRGLNASTLAEDRLPLARKPYSACAV